MRTFKIRRGTLADVETIASFNEAMALETEKITLDPETIRAGVAGVLNSANHGCYFLAEMDREVAGCLMITYEWSDWRNGQFWWIQSVFVRPQYRRHGVYRQLYGFVRQQIIAQPEVCGLRLYMDKDNDVASQAYRSLGMHQTNYRLFEWVKANRD